MILIGIEISPGIQNMCSNRILRASQQDAISRHVFMDHIIVRRFGSCAGIEIAIFLFLYGGAVSLKYIT